MFSLSNLFKQPTASDTLRQERVAKLEALAREIEEANDALIAANSDKSKAGLAKSASIRARIEAADESRRSLDRALWNDRQEWIEPTIRDVRRWIAENDPKITGENDLEFAVDYARAQFRGAAERTIPGEIRAMCARNVAILNRARRWRAAYGAMTALEARVRRAPFVSEPDAEIRRRITADIQAATRIWSDGEPKGTPFAALAVQE